MEISGQTQVVVHLAYPSAHLKTPQLFNARCHERAIDAILVPWQVHPDHLAFVVDSLRRTESVPGMIVTIPHKEAVAALCDRLEGPAAQLRVANVVRKEPDGTLVGCILDGEGFVAGLKARGIDPKGRQALLLGAGGAAVAIANALLDAGVARLVVFNRTPERAERLVERLRALYPGRDISTGAADATGFDLVVNGTALGMKPSDALPLDAETIAPATVVAEVIMAPPVTELLHAAAARGAIIHEGRHMLTGQIDPLIDFVLAGRTGSSASRAA
jgi:shikimate dehydrogenase